MEETGQHRGKRELARMLERMDAYERGSIGLGALIGDLEALNDSLPDAPEGWQARFHAHWEALEEVYAGLAYEGRTQFDDLDRSLVDRSLTNLRRLIHADI